MKKWKTRRTCLKYGEGEWPTDQTGPWEESKWASKLLTKTGAGQTIHVVKMAELSRDQALGSKAWNPSSRKDNFEVGDGVRRAGRSRMGGMLGELASLHSDTLMCIWAVHLGFWGLPNTNTKQTSLKKSCTCSLSVSASLSLNNFS